jgi:hypothetical protein
MAGRRRTAGTGSAGSFLHRKVAREIDAIDSAYCAVADGDGQTQAAGEAGLDVRSASSRIAPRRSSCRADPRLIEKVRDIVGLDRHPPTHAVVFCVDEKSQIQASDRTQPVLPMRPSRRSSLLMTPHP